MDRNQLIGIIAGLVILVAVILGITFFTTQGPTPESLAEDMAAGLADLKTVKGRLQLGRDEQTLEYELWIERPRRLRAEAELEGLDRKAVFILMFNETEAWAYDPVLNLATVADRTKALPADSLAAGTSLLETMPDDLLQALQVGDVQILGDETIAGREAVRVQVLLPPEQNPFEGGELTAWLDKRTFYPLAIESDAGFQMRFSFIQFNEAIDPLTFVFFPPPGATVRRVGE